MDPSDGILLLIILFLIILSSFFSASETALTTVSRHRLRALAEEGNPRAALALQTLEDADKMLSAIFIGDTIANLCAAALTTVLAAGMGGWAMAAAVAVLIVLILVFGELSPKAMASVQAERLVLRNIRAIHLLIRLLTPLIFCLQCLARLHLWLLRVDLSQKPDSVTEDQLRSLVEESHEEGVLESEEKDMINNVFDLGESQAKDVMVPRVSVVCLGLDASYQEVLEVFQRERFTRIPIYEEDPDNIVGILNMKDLLLHQTGSPFRIKDYLREAYFTHEFKNTYQLFHEMRQASVTMAIVLDEYGYMAGLITMEDMVEEIVGDIRDEFDQEELEHLQKIQDGEYLVEGSFRLDNLNDEIGIHLENEDYDSIGGYLLGLLGHFPQKGEEATDTEGYRLIAEKVYRNRIEKVRLIFPLGAGEKEKTPLPSQGEKEAT